MKRPRIAPATTAFLLAVLFGSCRISAAGPDATEEAARLLSQDDASKAIAILEAALPNANRVDRPAMIGQLVLAYSSALKRAEASGNKDEAETLRDNLDILRRDRRGSATVKPGPSPLLSPTPQEPAFSSVPKASTLEPTNPESLKTAGALVKPIVLPVGELPPAAPLPEPEPLPAPSVVKSPTSPDGRKVTLTDETPSRIPITTPEVGDLSLKSADVAFLDKRYEEAGNVYAKLASEWSLPEDRRSHWAYCRAVSVVKRLNDQPTTSTAWASIDAEIRAIQTLSPGNWFAEYLRNLASERSGNVRAPKARSNARVVVRGSSPEEMSRNDETPVPPGSLAPPPPPRRPATIKLPGSELDWNGQPVTSNNFHVHYVGESPALARQVAQAAEEARAIQMKRWEVVTPGGSWTPRCEILLYPSPDEFGKDTKQPPDSPGFSSMGMNAGRIVFRRVHLRANHPNLVKAVLPHEVTHVVLADIFPKQQIPRWADEGVAVLAEPNSEQAIRAADLEEPLKAGKLFRLSDLMSMDYPDPKHWSLYYAQSVSLTRFLVDAGTPAQFIAFVKHAQNAGIEPALVAIYKIESHSELQKRWLASAKARAASASATNVATSNDESETKTR